MIGINNLSFLSDDEKFLMKLLTFESYDDVKNAFNKKGVDISLEGVIKIKNIVDDLEKNESIIEEKDLQIINGVDISESFNEDLYNFFYNSRDKYSFLNKEIYDGETISTGIFAVSCFIFKAKKKYLKTKPLWEISL